ncbi:hypothetical protein ACFQ0E_10360 [Lysobacter brunescens]|uniref:Uncharacterized protein n=1 Tax=Lysobacter brunescens TaxID=262323 RepID=A0ABW2YFD1_9GAMM
MATAAAVAARPAAPAAFDPFPDREKVPVRDLFAALSREADRLSTSQLVRDEYQRLIQAHGLPDDSTLFPDYLRVRIAFEATRAGGLWGLQWRVTDQLPQSDRIWAQWDALVLPADGALPPSTAIAECDELSALFAVVAHGMGLSSRSRVGLFWPTSTHTVAVWTIQPAPAGSGNMPAEVRIVVPTSQIFLDGAQSLGTRGFDPWTQPKVFPYARRDIAEDHPLPAALARYFVQQVRRHASDPQGLLQTARNRREYDQRMRARDAGEDRR